VSDPIHGRNLDERREREAEESHRLLYVAMTRAAERLILTSAGPGLRSDWPTLIESALQPVVLDQAPPRFDLPARRGDETAAAGIEFVRVEPHVTHDSNVSISRLLEFQRCPRRAYLMSVLPALDDGETGPAAAGFGRAVHRVLAGLAPGGPEEQALADQFRHSELGRRAARARRIEHEYDFMIEAEGVILRGQIDLWFEESGEIVVVDYKTDARPPADRIEAYRAQMRFYALAVEKACGRPPDRCVVVFLRSGREEEVASDGAWCRSLVRAWKDSFADPVPRPGAICDDCPYHRTACPGQALLPGE
jgi:RecB family exonuclease